MRSFLLALSVLAASPAFAQERWPQLQGAPIPGCTQALEVGRSLFRSDAFALDGRPSAPPGATIALGVADRNAYSSDGIIADQTFEEMPPADGEHGYLHWARVANSGVRLVILAYEFNWRGYNYETYAVPEATTPQEFRAAWRNDTGARALAGVTWTPPIILRDNATGSLTMISLDDESLPDWRVSTQTANGFEWACTVRFAPQTGADLLPAPARLFTHRLNATLGSDNEGDLRPISRIRGELAQTWTNVALRPWALTSAPYNSRAQVDEGLRLWSRQAPSFRTAYDALMDQYPRAERALAAYYERRFALTPTQAREMAAYAMDIALRSGYVFAGEQRTTLANPWPTRAPRE